MKKIAFILAATVLLFATACNSNKKAQESNKLQTTIFGNSNGDSIQVTYDTTAETATVVFNGETLVLQQQPSASGIVYKNDQYEYTEWQDEVELTQNGSVIFSNVVTNTGMVNTFTDADGNTLVVTYDTTGEVPTATITYGDYKEVDLSQIPESAWAKGAEYANETLKWVNNAEGGVLTVDGKEITFKEAK